MATRKRTTRTASRKKKKTANSFELTRLKLLYGLSGAFTMCVAGLLVARPAPLRADRNDPSVLAAQNADPLDSAIGIDRGIDPSVWNKITVERADSLSSASFHFAVLPQPSGDQIAIGAEWNRQADFAGARGELKVALVSPDASRAPGDEKTIRLLVSRLANRLRMNESAIEWR